MVNQQINFIMIHLIYPVRKALLITVALIFYFITLSFFNLHTSPIFSLFNTIITGIGLFLSLKAFKMRLGKDFNYYKGFIFSIYTGFLSVTFFTIFFLIFITEIQPLFLEEMLESFYVNYFTGPGIVCFVVAIMGYSTVLVTSLMLMMYVKNPITELAYK